MQYEAKGLVGHSMGEKAGVFHPQLIAIDVLFVSSQKHIVKELQIQQQ